ATRGPTSRPIRTEPVADTSSTRGSSSRISPTARSPTSTWLTSGDWPHSSNARERSSFAPSADSSASSDGFHTTGSPHTIASAVFHAYGATGKLNARSEDDNSELNKRFELVIHLLYA